MYVYMCVCVCIYIYIYIYGYGSTFYSATAQSQCPIAIRRTGGSSTVS